MSSPEITTDPVILPPATIELGDDIRMSLTTAADADAGYAYHDRNREFFSKTLDFAAGFTYDQAVERFRENEDSIAAGNFIEYRIWDGEEMIGSVDMLFADADVASLGYTLAEHVQGRGIITRASRVVIDFAFNQKGVNRVLLDIKPHNMPSQRVAARLGAHKTGQLTQRGDSTFEIWELKREVV